MKRPTGLAASAVASLILVLASCGDGTDPEPSPGGPQGVIAFGARNTRDGGSFGLYTVRPDSSDLKLISREEGFIFFPRWSPDGSRIAYIVGTEGETAGGVLNVYDFAGNSSSQLSEAALPSLEGPSVAWSPDGRFLAFADGEAAPLLRIYDLESGGIMESGDILAQGPDWSPRGDIAVLHSEQAGGEPDVFLVQPDGTGLEQLLARAGFERGLRWSPDGERLAFWTAAPPTGPAGQLLAVFDRGSGEIRALGFGLEAAWSPDGRWLAYAGRRDDSSADVDVLLVPADGGEPETLNEAGSRDGAPSWSPRSDGLVYQALVDADTAFLCLARLDPPERDCLDLPGLVPGAPAWSPR